LAKATARAHTIQGLLKYHGLKNKELRVPYHNSISVCVKELTTTATIEFGDQYSENLVEINGLIARGNEAQRVRAVIDPLQRLANKRDHFRLVSKNSLLDAKGLGFSASAFASIARSASTALGLSLDSEHLSEIARLGSASASRSVAGGFAVLYTSNDGRCFARQVADEKHLPLAMGIVPVASELKTEKAHEEIVGSPFFTARLKEVDVTFQRMLGAINRGEVDEVCRLAEDDSLSLHATTMTGKGGLILMSPESIHVIRRVRTMREEGVPVWFSLDSGPSVFLNTHLEYLNTVCGDIERNCHLPVIKSGVGGPAYSLTQHLF
jgi:phosphomevalonate decarboxylase